ncbi:MAG TPA: helix-turn-helix domain-containing protein [Fimbriimonadaceae bacterium]|nr:helix-turn-helix domain-containing protein [Fimbriimonadaceae bacterium]
MKSKKEFDPLAYIENAFLDRDEVARPEKNGDLDVDIPSIGAYLKGGKEKPAGATAVLDRPVETSEPSRGRFRKTVMSAPRPRRAKQVTDEPKIDPALQSVWETLPKNIEFLCSFYDDSVTSRYYGGEFKESREELIRRLLDPELSLEETSRLLGVCPATVRRYTNRNWLTHHRTTGGQRRFRLSDIVGFVEAHGRFPQE